MVVCGKSNDDVGANDGGGVDTNSSNDSDCADGKRKAVCNEGAAGDDGSNGDGDPNDDSGVDTNNNDAEGNVDDNNGDNNGNDDGDKYDDNNDDAVVMMEVVIMVIAMVKLVKMMMIKLVKIEVTMMIMMIMIIKMVMMVLNANFCNLILPESPLYLIRILCFRIQLDIDDLYKITRN